MPVSPFVPNALCCSFQNNVARGSDGFACCHRSIFVWDTSQTEMHTVCTFVLFLWSITYECLCFNSNLMSWAVCMKWTVTSVRKTKSILKIPSNVPHDWHESSMICASKPLDNLMMADPLYDYNSFTVVDCVWKKVKHKPVQCWTTFCFFCLSLSVCLNPQPSPGIMALSQQTQHRFLTLLLTKNTRKVIS